VGITSVNVSNVLNEEKKKQVIALGQLGWALRRIEKETGIRRETASGYLKAAGISVRPAGGWGKRKTLLSKPANEVTTGPEAAKPANGAPVTTGSGEGSKPPDPTARVGPVAGAQCDVHLAGTGGPVQLHGGL
jgi:hypothetical protein